MVTLHFCIYPYLPKGRTSHNHSANLKRRYKPPKVGNSLKKKNLELWENQSIFDTQIKNVANLLTWLQAMDSDKTSEFFSVLVAGPVRMSTSA